MKKIWIILGTSFGLLLISFLIWFFFFDIRIILVNGDSIVSTIYNDYHDPGIIIKQHNKEINPSKYQLTMINNVNKDLFGKYTASYEIKYRLRTFKLTREIIVTDDMNPLILADKEKITRDYCSHKILDKFTYTIYDNYDGEITDKGILEEEEDNYKITIIDSHDNVGVLNIPIILTEKPADIFKLNGTKTTYAVRGSKYVDSGVTYTDGCGNKLDGVITNNAVDTSKNGTYEVKYEVGDKKLTREV